jgi:simple sugar transport system substrate-binding protein
MAAAFCILGAACTGGESDQTTSTTATTASTTAPDSSAQRFRLGMAVHNEVPTQDPFWTVIALGAFEAADSFNVDLELRGDYNPGLQARIVETMIAEGVDGLIVSLPDPKAIEPALDQAAAAGVPVITINSGIDSYLKMGALTHVGQSERAAGRAVGDRLTAMQLSGNVLCLIQETGNIGLEHRCDGVEATYAGGEVIRIREDAEITGTAEMISVISGELEKGGYAAVVALSPLYGMAAADAVKATQVDAVVTSFDFFPPMIQDLRGGVIAFTVDQRAYLQGYTPVQLLAEFLRDGTTPDQAQPVETGPFLIDATNVDVVAAEIEDIYERCLARFGP